MTEFTDFLRMTGLIVRSPAIYRIVNLENGKFYIGSTINVVGRARRHWHQLRAGTHHCIGLHAACTHGRPSLGYRWRWANGVR